MHIEKNSDHKTLHPDWYVYTSVQIVQVFACQTHAVQVFACQPHAVQVFACQTHV